MTETTALEVPKAPFFILGCVRSGTTMLRNVLRLHPHLACPEETHFFRWSDPFGTEGYRRTVTGNPVLKRHRELDGISEAEFADILAQATSRIDLCERYISLYTSRAKPGATRWFDKTPQNVYGAPLIAAMPGATFVHIVRNPENVVASLRIGKVMKIADLVAACNYWNEATEIIRTLRRAYPRRIYEVRYEDFVSQPEREINALCDFLGEPFDYAWFQSLPLKQVDHGDAGVLTEDEKAKVRELCQRGRQRYGYAPRDPAKEPVRRAAVGPEAEERRAARRQARQNRQALRAAGATPDADSGPTGPSDVS